MKFNFKFALEGWWVVSKQGLHDRLYFCIGSIYHPENPKDKIYQLIIGPISIHFDFWENTWLKKLRMKWKSCGS